MELFAIGCSWTSEWPTLVPCDWAAHDGKGVDTFRQYLEQAVNLLDYDAVVVQLPTPIRRGEGFTDAGIAAFAKRVEGVGERLARRWLLGRYDEDLRAMRRLHTKVRFFLFEVGGYPFRKPYDFGEDVRRRYIDRLSPDLIHLDLGDDQRYWKTADDYHPNKSACELAAKLVAECCANS